MSKQKTRVNLKLPLKGGRGSGTRAHNTTSQALESSLWVGGWGRGTGHGNEVSLFINTVHALKDPGFSKF